MNLRTHRLNSRRALRRALRRAIHPKDGAVRSKRQMMMRIIRYINGCAPPRGISATWRPMARGYINLRHGKKPPGGKVNPSINEFFSADGIEAAAILAVKLALVNEHDVYAATVALDAPSARTLDAVYRHGTVALSSPVRASRIRVVTTRDLARKNIELVPTSWKL